MCRRRTRTSGFACQSRGMAVVTQKHQYPLRWKPVIFGAEGGAGAMLGVTDRG